MSSKRDEKKDGKKSGRKSAKKQESDEEMTEQKDMPILEAKKRAKITQHGINDPSTYEHPASFASATGHLEPSNLKHFALNVDIEVKQLTQDKIVFDLIGAEPPLANALRRIMISEVPTIAIEKVTMWQNTSVIPDENLAHRIGLVPLNVDARQFEYVKGQSNGGPGSSTGNEVLGYNEFNSLNFKLHKKCSKKVTNAPMIINETHNEEELFYNSNIYSGDLEWIPIGNQKERLGDVKPLHDDILIAKLRPGQEIEMDLICVKGIGKTHAKWQPVCTAYYRMLPDIKFNQVIKGKEAEKLKKICPMGVFDIEDIGKERKAIVKNSRNCTTCRECLRHGELSDKIDLGKLKDVFEFTVESLGMYKPEEIVTQSFEVLKSKSKHWLNLLSENEK